MPEFIERCPCELCAAGRRARDQGGCYRCGEQIRSGDQYPVAGTFGDTYLCRDCALEHFFQCFMCERWESPEDVVVPIDEGGGYRGPRHYCAPCARARLTQCDDCGDWSRYADQPNYCDGCAPQEYDDDDDCFSDDDDADGMIHSYCYTPSPLIFHGDGPVYLGMELEVSVPYGSVRRAVHTVNDRLGGLVYIKSDSSVDGFEIVTHPATHEYFRTRVDWQFLDDLERLDCSGDRNGIHVHVSREGFDSPAHVYRWMRLIYRNSRQVQLIARRRSTDWASFGSHDPDMFKEYAKGSKDGARYSAINVQNDHTFEVRIFRGSLNKQEVMAALDLVDASVEYTRNLTVPAIMNGGWTWAGFMAWAEEDPRYTALVAENMERV